MEVFNFKKNKITLINFMIFTLIIVVGIVLICGMEGHLAWAAKLSMVGNEKHPPQEQTNPLAVTDERSVDVLGKVPEPNDPIVAAFLNNLGYHYCRLGDYDKALPLYKRSLSTWENILGPEHPDVAVSLNNLGSLYASKGDFKKALPLLERALAIKEQTFGQEHPGIARGLNNLGALYQLMGNYAQALPLYERTLAVFEKAFGPEHPEVAKSLDRLGSIYIRLGEYEKAEPVYKRALSLSEKSFGPEHSSVSKILYHLGALYEKTGDYDKALPFYQRALNIEEKTVGAEHPDLIKSLNRLGALYEKKGLLEKAVPFFQRAIQIWEQTLGGEFLGMTSGLLEEDPPMSNEVVAEKSQGASLAEQKDDVTKRSEKRSEEPLPLDTAKTLINQAHLYKNKGEYRKAVALYKKAVGIKEKILGLQDLEIAQDLNYLGSTYENMGDYAKALPLYMRALGIQEKKLGRDHPEVEQSLMSLGYFYYILGADTNLVSLYDRLLKIWDKTLDVEPQSVSGGLQSSHYFYYGRPLPLYEQSLEVEKKGSKEGPPEVVKDLNNLAFFYKKNKNYEKALLFYEKGLVVVQKILGEEHFEVARQLSDLGALYRRMGMYTKAISCFEQAVQIWEKIFGPQHPAVVESLNRLGYLYMDMGDKEKALEVAENAQKAEFKMLSTILSFASEKRRLAYQGKLNPYTLVATLDDPQKILLAILRNKGVVFDSLVKDIRIAAASRAVQHRALVEDRRRVKDELIQWIFEVPKNANTQGEEREETIRELSERIEEIESQLARYVRTDRQGLQSLEVTIKEVRKTLPKRTVLIEFIRYWHYLGEETLEARYGAVVLPPAGNPVWVSIGNAMDVDQNIEKYEEFVQSKWADEKSFSDHLEVLYNQIWVPLEAVFPQGTKAAIISPDSRLNFLSFVTLGTPERRFLGEKYKISYVSSGRDLLREESKESDESDEKMVVFADPKFSDKRNPLSTGETFDPLPGAAKEAKMLKNLGEDYRWRCALFMGEDASEMQLRKIRSPRILHLATHGFFRGDSIEEEETFLGIKLIRDEREWAGDLKGVLAANPRHQGGVALAGAQATLNRWRKGEPLPIRNDGIVTAQEISLLNLKDTWLVVLSACNTGLGEVKSGEDVLGLRRGFAQAGAQNLLMTLWKVSDEETTPEIMRDFYTKIFEGSSPAQALSDTQLKWLVTLRNEKGVHYAVQTAGPFMVSQGHP